LYRRGKVLKFRYRLWKTDQDFINWSKQKWILLRVYVVFALIIGVMYASDTMMDARRDKSTAYAIAKNFVSQRLVAPETVHFPPKSDERVFVDYLGANRYSISGYLYSRNTFGNEKRSDYTCVIRDVGSGEWTYENIFFE